MMKRLLCLLVVVVLVFGLVACGEDQNSVVGTTTTEESNETEGSSANVTEPSTAPEVDTLESVDGFEGWGLRDVNLPEISPMTWETVKITEEVSREIAETPLNVNVEELWKALGGNEFLSSTYKGLSYAYSEDTRFYVKDYPFYTVSEEISGHGISNTSSAFNLSFDGDLGNYSNYSTISMYFYEPGGFELTEELQQGIYSVVKSVYGDCADLLVYGKDSDGLRYNGDYWYDQSMSEVVDFGDYAYCFERHIDNDKEKIEFKVWVWDKVLRNWDIWHGIPRDSVYSTFPVGFEDVLPKEFGSTNPLDGSTFANGWFGQFSGYKSTDVSNIVCTVRKYATGETEYIAKVGFSYSNEGEESVSLSSKYAFCVTEKDGSLSDAEIAFNIGNFKKQGSNEETFNALKSFASVLIKDTDLSELVFVDGEKYIFQRVTVPVLGFSQTEKIQVVVNDEFSFILNMNLIGV